MILIILKTRVILEAVVTFVIALAADADWLESSPIIFKNIQSISKMKLIIAIKSSQKKKSKK